MKFILTVFTVVFTSTLASCLEIVNSQVPSTRKTDLTLVAGSSRVEVVEACIQKINTVPDGIFGNDLGFLKRVALLESNFGSNITVINLYPKGGIWQITPDIHQTVLDASSSIATSISAIAEILGSDVVDFTSDDYSVPLKSALAARIFIELRGNLPGSLDEQGQWWATNYHNGSSSAVFVSIVQQFEESTRCKATKLDLWFLIDGSESVGQKNFTTCLEFVNKTASTFPISANEVRTGLMVYASTTYTISRFDLHMSNTAFSNQVFRTKYPGGETYTGFAIDEVRKYGFNEKYGARPATAAVPRILIVLTDGKSDNDVQGSSENIKEAGVTVFGVGVGNQFDNVEIKEIASDPDLKYAYEFTEFDALVNVLKGRVVSQACTVPAVIHDDIKVSVVVEARSTFYSRITLPNNGSVELVHEMSFTDSIPIVYVSDSVQNPNKAFFELSFTVIVGITRIVINSGDLGGPPELVNKRGKRATPEQELKSLYLAFVSQSDTPVDLNFTAKSSNVSATASPITSATSQSISTSGKIVTTASDGTTGASVEITTTAADRVIATSSKTVTTTSDGTIGASAEATATSVETTTSGAGIKRSMAFIVVVLSVVSFVSCIHI